MITRKRSQSSQEASDSDLECTNGSTSDVDCSGNSHSSQRARKKRVVKSNKNSISLGRKRWTMILPGQVTLGQSSGDVNYDGIFCKLPHPKTGSESLFLFCGKDIYEVLKFKEQFSSWFVNDSVQKDGSLVIAPPVDPLFLAIQYLESAWKTNTFRTMDQLLVDKRFPSIRNLEQCLTNENLCNICDCKGSQDLLVYRLNSDRLMAWLILKVERLAKHLKTLNISVKGGSQVSTLIRSSKDSDVRDDDYMRYAFGLVSDYVSPDWSRKLKDSLQIEDKSPLADKETLEPPVKKQRTDDNGSQECTEDYRKFNSKKTTDMKSNALTPSQKKLAKIDKTGMKSLTSFFSAKTKK